MAKRYPRVNLTCEQCNIAFTRPPSNRRNTRHDFCGRACSALWHKGKAINYNPNSLKGLVHDFWSNPLFSDTQKQKVKEKISEANIRRGYKEAEHWNWKGGVTPLNKKIRNSIEYKQWRRAVFLRDNFTCQNCSHTGYLEADHIKPFAYFPELRFDLDNGRTLCLGCHKQTDTYMGKAKKYQNVSS